MGPLRDLPEYKRLIAEYTRKTSAAASNSTAAN
jgi:hypothetical protein